MPVTIKGREAQKDRLLRRIPEALEKKILRPAAMAAGEVIADDARARSISARVSEAIVVEARHEDGKVRVQITVKGRWPRAVGTWLEWGTSPHFISVDKELGMTAGKVNRDAFVINGQFVSTSVHHPGVTPHPFLRPALYTKAGEAITTAQRSINTSLARRGLSGPDAPERDDG